LPTPERPVEKDYAIKSWPGKLPKDWSSQITVEFQRTYGRQGQPSLPNTVGGISSLTSLPIVPGGNGNPDNELYEASASIEVDGTSDLEGWTAADIGTKSLDGQNSVKWTIPFRLKSNVAQQANFILIFIVHLRNKKTGKELTTSYSLGREAIAVDWIPGTRGQAYGLFGLLLPVFGVVFLRGRLPRLAWFNDLTFGSQELLASVGSMPTEEVVLHANLWIEDIERRPIANPPTLQLSTSYLLLFAIEPRIREMVSSTQPFVEPPEFREDSVSDVKIQVVSSLLKNELGHETRDVKYHSGIGFAPETFDLATPEEEGHHFVTVRLFFRQTIIFRERIRVEVKSVARAARA
jgi:hypothetical protein